MLKNTAGEDLNNWGDKMAKSFKENLKTGAKSFAFLIVLAVVMSAFSGDNSAEENKNVGETTVTEQEVSASQAEAPTEVATPEPTPEVTPEEEKPTKHDDAKVEEDDKPKKSAEEEDLEAEYRAKLAEQETEEEEEEETPIETSSHNEESTITDDSLTADDILWLSTGTSDATTVATTLNSMSLAAQDLQDGIGSKNSLILYAQDLERETEKALDNSNKYTVSSEFSEAQSEYNKAMNDYNKAAKLVIQAMDAYNQGNANTFSSLISQSSEYLKSGSEHSNRATALLKDYNEKHDFN